jgi:alkylation response protein AidB-like acyl-CoA dehydrogenase
MLPYGRNKIDIEVPSTYRLEPKTTGVTMMLDILHRSRLQFPGMSTGHLKRMLDEALEHCKERIVGGVSLFNYDQVKERLAKLQSYFTVSSAMSYFTSSNVTIAHNTARMDVEANSIKSVVTDYMHEASQSLLQLVGAKGYRLDHVAGRSMVDSRPFQIFEGSNDILYQQISESVLKLMRKSKENNLYQFLKGYKLTENSVDHLRIS